MPNSFYGLPLHPLIVHATVIMIPFAALMVLLAAAWPRFRAWAGPLPLVVSAIGLVLVSLSTSTAKPLSGTWRTRRRWNGTPSWSTVSPRG